MIALIRVKHKGNFNNTENWFDRMLRHDHLKILSQYGEKGVEALKAATPVDSGVTADSWSYEVEDNGKTSTITFKNSNESNGVNIVILLKYGHGTKNGGYVQANDFVTPALEPVFKDLANAAWREVTK